VLKTADVATAADPTAGPPTPMSLALDAAGNLYLAGQTLGNTSFTSASGTQTLTYTNTAGEGPGGGDVLVVKLDPSGKYLWGFNYGQDKVTPRLSVNGPTVGVTHALVFNIPQSQLGVGIHGTGTLTGLGDAGKADIFVAAFASDSGAYKWAKGFRDVAPSNAAQDPQCVSVDPSGDVLLAGSFEGTFSFDPAVPANALQVADTTGTDTFVAKLAGTNGQQVWSKAFAGKGSDLDPGLQSTDTVLGCKLMPGAGDLYVYGTYDGATINFGGTPITNANEFSTTGFLARFNAAGQHVYSGGFPNGLRPTPASTGSFYLGVASADNLNLGGGALKGSIVALFNAQGVHQASTTLQPQTTAIVQPLVGANDSAFALVIPQAQGATLWRRGP
jgi:hypothetical protein